MADNYFNPTSVRPDNGWKPEGFLGGMYHSRDRQRYEDVAAVQDYMQRNDAVKSASTLTDYFKDAPVREAERGSKIATANATRDTIGLQKHADLRKTNLENDLAEGTLKSKISQSISEAAIKGGVAVKDQMEQMGAMAAQLARAAKGGPDSLARVMQHLQASGANPQTLKFFGNMSDPKQIQAVSQAINEGLLDASEKYQQHMRGIEEQRKSMEKIAGIQAQAQRDVADIRQKAKQKDIDQMFQEVLKLAPDKRIQFYSDVINNPDATVEQQQRAVRARAEAVKAIELNAKSDSPGIPGLPADQRRQFDQGPGSGRVQEWTRDAQGRPVPKR